MILVSPFISAPLFSFERMCTPDDLGIKEGGEFWVFLSQSIDVQVSTE